MNEWIDDLYYLTIPYAVFFTQLIEFNGDAKLAHILFNPSTTPCSVVSCLLLGLHPSSQENILIETQRNTTNRRRWLGEWRSDCSGRGRGWMHDSGRLLRHSDWRSRSAGPQSATRSAWDQNTTLTNVTNNLTFLPFKVHDILHALYVTVGQSREWVTGLI